MFNTFSKVKTSQTNLKATKSSFIFSFILFKILFHFIVQEGDKSIVHSTGIRYVSEKNAHKIMYYMYSTLMILIL